MVDPLMEGYAPLIESDGILYEAKDYPPRIRGIVPGKTEQEISIHPNKLLDFGNVVIGQVSSTYPVLFVNRGYKIITLNSIEVVGNFIAQPITNLVVEPGAIATITVAFSPKSVGSQTGGLYVNAENVLGEKFIKLIGFGFPGPVTSVTDINIISDGGYLDQEGNLVFSDV